MTKIECPCRECLSNRKGCCIANGVTIDKRCKCKTYLTATRAMMKTYDNTRPKPKRKKGKSPDS